MKILPLDIAIVVWGVVGTLVIKFLLPRGGNGSGSRLAFFGTTLVLGIAPLIALRSDIADYSAFGVVSAAIVVFWFAILAGRKGIAT